MIKTFKKILVYLGIVSIGYFGVNQYRSYGQSQEQYIKDNTFTKTAKVVSVHTNEDKWNNGQVYSKHHVFEFVDNFELRNITVHQSKGVSFPCKIFIDETITDWELTYVEYEGQLVEVKSIKVPNAEKAAYFKVY